MSLFETDTPPPAKRGKTFAQSDIDAIYQIYPRHEAKKDACKAIHDALKYLQKKGCSCPVGYLLEAVTEYRNAVDTWPKSDKKFRPLAGSWFRAGRWEDDRQEWFKGDTIRPQPTARISRQWEQKLLTMKHAISNAPSERERHLRLATWDGTVKRMTPRLLEDHSIAAIIASVEVMR